MTLTLISALSALGLFAGMVLLLEIGRRLGRRRQAKEEAGARAGLGQVEGAVFALMGLLVAFTFSGAASPVISQASLGTVTGLVAKPSPEREPGAFCWS